MRQYLTEEDWKDLARIVRDGYEPLLASTLLAQTYRLMDQESWKQALIEGITALELAIDENIYQRVGSDQNLYNLLKSSFNELPLRIKVISIGTFLDKFPLEDINYTANTIQMRNNVIHEGWDPSSPNEVKVALGGLVRFVTVLLPDPGFKFPTAKQGLRLKVAETVGILSN